MNRLQPDSLTVMLFWGRRGNGTSSTGKAWHRLDLRVVVYEAPVRYGTVVARATVSRLHYPLNPPNMF
jgi:hypothetical protein